MTTDVAPTSDAPLFSALAVPVEVLPEARREQFGPNGPAPLRNMAARALLPMPPGELAAVLAYFARCSDDALARTARGSIAELPVGVVLSVLEQPDVHPSVLDVYAEVLRGTQKVLETIILHNAVADATLEHLASSLDDPGLLDLLARNEVRCLACPSIIERLYVNPDAPTGAVGRIVELAVRQGVALEHLPAYRELAEAILGKHFDAAPEASDAEGIPDDEFRSLLKAVAQPGSLPHEATAEGEEAAAEVDEDAGKDAHKALWMRLRDMSTHQKVRLAIIGDQVVRRYLVRDPRKVVALSVLQNPKITVKEVAGLASQKALDEDVVKAIGRNRDWTKHYAVRHALVRNPKTGFQAALQFLQSLTERDIRMLQRDREVSGYVQKQAGLFLARVEEKRKR
jgi:hypothetical protein